MPRSFLILHGIENMRPPQHWQFLLAARLVERGETVFYPGMPDPDAPRFHVWEAVLHRHLEEMEGDRVVICHSLACLLWLEAADGIGADERATRLLLVAPPASDLIPESGAAFRLDAVDAGAVRASVNGSITLVTSNNDPFNPESGAHAMYAAPLGIDATQIDGAGHFVPETGYGAWPAITAWCLDPSMPIHGA